ncbi:MAG: hypothetical protein WBM78_15025 [Desulfobacterales bacterium]
MKRGVAALKAKGLLDKCHFKLAAPVEYSSNSTGQAQMEFEVTADRRRRAQTEKIFVSADLAETRLLALRAGGYSS